MSAKIGRLLPALLIGCAMSLLVAACGGKESEPGAATSGTSTRSETAHPSTVRLPAAQGNSAPAGIAQPEHDRQSGNDTRHKAPRPSPKAPATPSNASDLVEHILGGATPDRSDRDRAHARRVIDRLLAKARKEGVEVVEQRGGGEGVKRVLQQLGGRNP